MNKELFANLLVALRRDGLPLIAKLMADYSAGRDNTTVTPEDVLELHRLSTQTGADIYAKMNVAPPPAT